jgi:hypothetical protein
VGVGIDLLAAMHNPIPNTEAITSHSPPAIKSIVVIEKKQSSMYAI